METITILLTDDHVVVRERTRQPLEREEDFAVVGEADDGKQAVGLATQLQPELALMDVAMPKLSGIEPTRQIKSTHRTTAVFVLTGYDDGRYVFACLEAADAGCLLKDVVSRDLIEAIRALNAGQPGLHPVSARTVVSRSPQPLGEPAAEDDVDQLTERRLPILRLAARGLSKKKIARELVPGVRRVQGHLQNVFDKIQVGSRAEIVVQGLRQGRLTLDGTR
jgi:NarL family two-component system response regulator LiaR